ncbi:MAG: LiaF transmembrane domain-containing protein [Halanaerobiales bacterium]
MTKNSRSQIVVGIVLIALGTMFLLNTMGINTGINWRLLFKLWPLILVFIGLNILLKKTKLWWVVPLLIVATLIFVMTVGPNFYSYYRYGYEHSGILQENREYKEDMELLDVDLKFPAGSLKLDKVNDNNNLFYADLKYDEFKPDIDVINFDSSREGKLKIYQKGTYSFFGISDFDLSEDVNDWNIYLGNQIPLDINVKAGAGELDLDFSDLMIDNCDIKIGAGDLEIKLGDYARNIELNSGAAQVELSVPYNQGIEIKSQGVINRDNFSEEGLLYYSGSKSFRTDNYEEAENKTFIEIKVPVSNIELEFYEK